MSLLEEMPRNKIKENKKAIWGLIVDTPPPKGNKILRIYMLCIHYKRRYKKRAIYLKRKQRKKILKGPNANNHRPKIQLIPPT
jgi:hypothetical protein